MRQEQHCDKKDGNDPGPGLDLLDVAAEKGRKSGSAACRNTRVDLGEGGHSRDKLGFDRSSALFQFKESFHFSP